MKPRISIIPSYKDEEYGGQYICRSPLGFGIGATMREAYYSWWHGCSATAS